MSSKHEIFISVDVETSGPVPGEYSMLSIGACDVDDDDRAFSCNLKPLSRKADPNALAVSGFSLDALEKTGLPPEEAMRRFRAWLELMAEETSALVFVGFNAPFDWSFVNYYFHRFLGENPFGFSALDIKAYYMGATGCQWGDTRSSKIASSLSPVLRGNHTALHDARYQAELFRLIRGRRLNQDNQMQ